MSAPTQQQLSDARNVQRADKARVILAAYREISDWNSDPSNGGHWIVADLLADIRHYLAAEGLSWEAALRLSHEHFTEECIPELNGF